VSVTVETTLSKQLHILMLFLLLLLSATVRGQWSELPTDDFESRTMRIQIKAEGLYTSGDYKRAHFIYVKELAPLGDKYAQYMTGYMYLMGQGVPEDPLLASAWYRIAAERKSREFMVVRDDLMRTLDAQQLARSDSLYLDLRKGLSDLVIVMKLLEKDLEKLQVETTGSRVAGQSSMITMVDPKSGNLMSAKLYRDRVRRALQARVDYITAQLDIEPLDAELSRAQVAELWDRIKEHVAVVDDEVDTYVANP
jgi:hypothetical protein